MVITLKNFKCGIFLKTNTNITLYRLAQLVILAFTLAIFFSYGLQFYVPVMILLPWVHSKVSRENHLKAEFALRYGLVLITCKLQPSLLSTEV